MAFSFGQPAATNANPTFSFGNAQPAQNAFGQNNTNTAPAANTFSFGQTPQSNTQPNQAASSFSFGAPASNSTAALGGNNQQATVGQGQNTFGQTQNPFGQTQNTFGQTQNTFGQAQGTPGSFGQTQTNNSGLFGQPAQNQTQSLSQGLFGGPASTSFQSTPQTGLFGQAQNTQNTPTSFNQTQQQGQLQSQQANPISQNQSSLSQSIYGQTINQPKFSWSRPSQPLSQSAMPTFATSGNLTTTQAQPLSSTATTNYGPSQPASIQEQLTRLKNSWDPTHTDNLFQFYFYNRVAPETASLYTKPENHKQAAWDDAVANRSDNSVVPVMGVGFTDLQARVNGQQQQIHAYRTRMHEIADKLKELDDRQLLHAAPKINVATRKHRELAQRALALATRVQVLRCRGYALRPEEEQLRARLTGLQKRLASPDTFGRLEEVWASMTLIRDREKAVQRDIDSRGYTSTIDFDHGDSLQTIEQILRDHNKGLQYLSKVIKDDLTEVESQLEKYGS